MTLSEEEYLLRAAEAMLWLNNQPLTKLSNEGETSDMPVDVAREFLRYTLRARGVVKAANGEKMGWAASKWFVEQPWGRGFWRPEMTKWAVLHTSGQSFEAEKYFWTSVFTSDQQDGWNLFSGDRVGYFTGSERLELESGEWRWIDDWGLDNATS